jgi:hypothetical protein
MVGGERDCGDQGDDAEDDMVALQFHQMNL